MKRARGTAAKCTRGALVLALCALGAGCATGPERIEEAKLRRMGTRGYVAPFDEVLAATVLVLERQGYLVTQADPRLGSVQATLASGRGYGIDLTQRGDEIQVTALPIPWQPAWQLSGPTGERARWDELEKNTRALLKAWKDHPEWKLDPGRNEVTVKGFTASLPREWEHVDQAVNRRQVVVQRFGPGHTGLNPTFVFTVMPRRLKHDLKRRVEETAGLAFDAPGRVVAAETLVPAFGRVGTWGTARVLVNAQDQELAYKQWDARSREWTVLVTAVCGTLQTPEQCEQEWMELTQTLDDRGFDHPR